MKEKLITRLYDFWSEIDDDKGLLLEEITKNVNDNIEGVEVLLDWCRNDFDGLKEQYQNIFNITDTDMENIMEEHCGSYEFMYEHIPYSEDLERVWDLLNWYKDYINGQITEEWLLDMIENY